MFCIYFAATSALSKSATLPSYTRSMLDGKFEDALRHVERHINIDGDHFEASSVMAFQALSDASLLLGHGEDAEENYLKAQKLLRGSNEKLNVFSCRNTAWQSLALHRYSAALNCFSRITQDASASSQQKIEAILGVAMIHHHLGQQAAADEALLHARVLAELEADTRWSMLIELLAIDFSTQLSIRCSAGLRDHAFWQSALVNHNLEAQMQTLRACMADATADLPGASCEKPCPSGTSPGDGSMPGSGPERLQQTIVCTAHRSGCERYSDRLAGSQCRC
jgi:tetratricopeptide (TPR) repeat protein